MFILETEEMVWYVFLKEEIILNVVIVNKMWICTYRQELESITQ